MMLGEMIAVETLGFEQLDELDALLELLRARGAVVVDVIEYAEAEHGGPRFVGWRNGAARERQPRGLRITKQCPPAARSPLHSLSASPRVPAPART